MKITLSNINDVYKAKKCSIETMELKGYKLIKNLFVDNSGFGAEDEPAYTQSQFIRELTELLNEYGQLTATITDVGQFQVYVGLFIRHSKPLCKRIGNNTLEVYNNAGKRQFIRLHDTNIIEYKDNKIILNSEGYQTHTTKKRINNFLPKNVYLYQKNWQWYIEDTRNDKKIVTEFYDGIEVML